MTFTFICHPGKTHDHRSRIPESIWTQGHKSIWTQGHKRKDRSLLRARAHTAKSPELEPPKGKGLSAGGELGHQSGVNKRWRREYRRLRRRRLSESRENQWSRHRLLDPAPTPLARTLKLLSNKSTHRPPQTAPRSSATGRHPIEEYWYCKVVSTARNRESP